MQIPKHHNVKNKECLRERIVEPEASQSDCFGCHFLIFSNDRLFFMN